MHNQPVGILALNPLPSMVLPEQDASSAPPGPAVVVSAVLAVVASVAVIAFVVLDVGALETPVTVLMADCAWLSHIAAPPATMSTRTIATTATMSPACDFSFGGCGGAPPGGLHAALACPYGFGPG